MRKEIYNAAVRGDIEFLTNARAKDVEAVAAAYSDDEFLGLTTHGNNIIHVAAKHGHLDFINSALQTFPESATRLVCGTNNDGDTPLHVAAKLPTSIVAEHLIAAIPSPSSAIWRAQNNNGNTPLHMALINGGKSLQVAAYLIQVGPQVASYANLRKEAPLHLAVQYCNEGARVSMTNMMNKINGLGASLDYRKSLYEDDSLPLIKLLLEASTGVCCLQDKDGFTPLLRATLNSNLSVVEVIINYCPECVEICDTKGRTILHHVKFPSFLETRKFLRIPEMSALIDQQDEDGNTALHIATMNYDYSKVKAMIECNANFMIRNHKGTSAASLIQSEPSSFLNNMKSEIVDYGELMAKELYEAAGNGEWQYLRERLQDSESEKQFLGRLPDGSNIIHVAVEDCPIDRDADLIYCSNNDDEDGLLQESFIVDALTKFPILSCQTNSKGLTPLHIAMRHRLFKPGGAPFKFLQLHLRHIYDLRSRFQLPPWKVQDEDGDTLLHMALKYSRYKFAEYLIELDEKCVGQINHYNKTPLHYLCKGYGSGNAKAEEEERDMVDLLVEKDVTVVYLCDADGFTPLLRAAHSYRLKIAARILHHCPQSIKQFDSRYGRNLFHLINFSRNDDMAQVFNKMPQMKHLLTLLDNEKNTPLHVAIEQHRFGTAKFLMEHLKDNRSHYDLLNKDGKTAIDMLYQVQDCPRWVSIIDGYHLHATCI